VSHSRIAGSRDAPAPVIVDAYTVGIQCIIVDDNPLFLEGAADLLEREGVDVVGVASTSAEAIRLVEKLHPDVTLVDIDLGNEDGFELARRLSADSARSSVILISTHAEEDFGQLIETSPAIGFISKTRLSAKTIRDTLARAA
jgi:DNA-binding NarL/FixJ family response regulator